MLREDEIRDYVEEEITAQYFGAMQQRAFCEEEVKKNPGLWEKVKEVFRRIVEDIKKKLEQLAKKDLVVKAVLEADLRDVQEAYSILDSVLRYLKEQGTETDAGVENEGTEKYYKLHPYEKPPIGIGKDRVFDIHTREHKEAVAWAEREDIHVRDQVLAFYNNRWYILEKFDDMDHGYLVMKHVKKTDYNKFINLGRLQNGRTVNTGMAGNHSRVDNNYRKTVEYGGEGYGPDDAVSEYAKEDQEIFRLDEDEDGGRPDTGDDSAGVIGGDENRQGNGAAAGRGIREVEKYSRVIAGAGEIEERDAEARASLTAEERKEKRPDVDRADVVFADGSGVSYSENLSDEERTIKEQLLAHREEIGKNGVTILRSSLLR